MGFEADSVRFRRVGILPLLVLEVDALGREGKLRVRVALITRMLNR